MSGGDCYWKLSHDGELYFEIPNECIVALDCSVGDEIVWSKNNDGSYSLSKDTKKLESNSVSGLEEWVENNTILSSIIVMFTGITLGYCLL
ncbi:hypothetical protein EWT61_10180 [Vibrio alginolyticus]|nr:hypothetical protein EWT61_10180 [Vibrio alginolyticus]